ncbi:MAG TPA: sigma factor, partial [Treponemataceae bacterium]|nr:sigma factor [Treponemataceae bacterium]
MKEELTEAYETERPRLLGWMQSRIGLEEAEDVLHDVMVRSLVNLDSLGGVRDLTAWLWRGVRNGVIDVWRRRARRRNAGEAELADAAEFDEFIDSLMEGVEDRLEREETLGLLADAIAA